jgi:hypothetical protein
MLQRGRCQCLTDALWVSFVPLLEIDHLYADPHLVVYSNLNLEIITGYYPSHTSRMCCEAHPAGYGPEELKAMMGVAHSCEKEIMIGTESGRRDRECREES